MPRRMLFPVVALVVLGSVDVAQSQFGGASDRAVVSDVALERAGYGEFWTTSVPIGNDRIAEADLVDENLYVTSRAGDVFVIQADTGLLRWAKRLSDRAVKPRRPTHLSVPGNDGPVVMMTNAVVNVFDRFSGDHLLRLELPFPAASGGVGDASNFYAGGVDGKFYCLRWPVDARGGALVRWKALVRGIVVDAPALAMGRVYFVSDGGVVYCTARDVNRLHWAYDVGDEVSVGIAVAASGIYAATGDYRLVVIDPDTGGLLHEYQLPDVLSGRPRVVQRALYQYCDGVGMYAFDTDTRAQLWVQPEARRFVARAAERLVMTDARGDLVFMDQSTGRQTGSLGFESGTMAVVNDRDAVLYLVTPDGRILCAKPRGFPYLRRESVMAARARLGFGPLKNHSSLDVSDGGDDSSGGGDAGGRDPLRSR